MVNLQTFIIYLRYFISDNAHHTSHEKWEFLINECLKKKLCRVRVTLAKNLESLLFVDVVRYGLLR